jgi:pyridoxal phosphate enzyme (YggS family)
LSGPAERLAAVRAGIADAARAAGRDPATIGLVAVSKKHPGSAIRAAYAAGHRDFGENYAQELRDKGAELADLDLRWHYIGRLQSNKAKYVAPLAFRMHALENVSQAEALGKRAPAPLKCLVSVHLGDEATKAGVAPAVALDRCAELDRVAGIQVVGLMALPPYREDPEDVAPFFEELADLAARGRARGQGLTELSMGMSHDYAVAIRHGATWVRVGTAIFGPRDG